MPYFALPYQVCFDDTMAYGTHHFLTNFKFQCAVRESLYFGKGPDARESWRQDDKIFLLTQEGYTRNLAPVELGGRVSVFMTFANMTRSTAHLCFRSVREDGRPVSCGYQTIVTVGRESGVLEMLPHSVAQYRGLMDEPLGWETFKEYAHQGGRKLELIFPSDLKEAARQISDPDRGFLPGLVKVSDLVARGRLDLPKGATALCFAGQGAYDFGVLRSLYSMPELEPVFRHADQLVRRFFGYDLGSILSASSEAAFNRALEICPDLDQMMIFLCNVLTARLMLEAGFKPDVLVGHSFGELAALTVSGALKIEQALELVCHRTASLEKALPGGMVALSCDRGTTEDLIALSGADDITISVLNQGRQTVVSGPRESLAELCALAPGRGINATLLKNRYPFHSPLMEPARVALAKAATEHRFGQPAIPVMSPIEGGVFDSSVRPATLLSAHLVTCCDFDGAIRALYEAGCRRFVEAGAGGYLRRLIGKVLGKTSDVTALAAIVDGDWSAELEPRPGSLFPAPRAVGSNPVASAEPASTLRAAAPEVAAAEASVAAAPAPVAEAPAKIESSNHTATTATTATAATTENTKSSDTAESSGVFEISEVIEPSEASPLSPDRTPIAIVAMGCVLPGVNDPQEYWKNMIEGISGIVDAGDLCPEMRDDFLSEGPVTADKSYTLLTGSAHGFRADPELLPYDEQELKGLTATQRFLASALAQCLSGRPLWRKLDGRRIQVLLGSTADSIPEHDEAYVWAGVKDIIASLDEPEPVRCQLEEILEKVHDAESAGAMLGCQQAGYEAVVERVLGDAIKTLVIDAACSSSLYSVDLGVKALQHNVSDLVFAGGVYSPGPANNSLFSQFKGLTANGSFPMDHRASGVVFGEGAAIIALKRLPDAIAAGDRVLGVIRGTGLSSDGKSPAVNVPRWQSQVLSMERAYAKSDIAPSSIQYLEAHATATPAGDATELRGLAAMFEHVKDRRIALGSVKSLIGHTGWVAGVASIIKVCLAFQHRLIPKQYGFEQLSPKIDLSNAPFDIVLEHTRWPENRDGLPRRAAVNSFGFGGTNAHLILEDFDQAYHGSIAQRVPRSPEQLVGPLAVVGVGGVFPSPSGGVANEEQLPPPGKFHRESLTLPGSFRILPDMAEHMDDSQYLALLAADRVLSKLPEAWQQLKEHTGTVLGVCGKTGRSLHANARVYVDHVRRLMTEHRGTMSAQDLSRALDKIVETIQADCPASGPYTLAGCMPNVTSGRVANLFDLRGPNIVVDHGQRSLFEAVSVAAQWLYGGDCRLALAGCVNGFEGRGAAAMASQRDGLRSPFIEGAGMLALMTPEAAAELGMPVVAILEVGGAAPDRTEEVSVPSLPDLRGAQGLRELIESLARVGSDEAACSVRFPATLGREYGPCIALQPARSAEEAGSARHSAGSPVSDIFYSTPVAVPSVRVAPEAPVEPPPYLLVTDDAACLRAARRTGLGGAVQVVCPPGSGIDGEAVVLDTSSEQKLAEGLARLHHDELEWIVVMKDLHQGRTLDLLVQDYDESARMSDLSFVLARRYYDDLASGRKRLAVLCLGGVTEGGLQHPETGLYAGMIKSLARELPTATVLMLNTTASSPQDALTELWRESQLDERSPSEWEVSYIAGERHLHKLSRLAEPVSTSEPYLGSDSVVIATGGGRGVTAVCVERMLTEHGCTVVLVGRTDPGRVPRSILELSGDQLDASEARFYADELARDPRSRIPELKRRFEGFRAAHELQSMLERFERLPGSVEYVSVDITEPAAVDAMVQRVVRRHGKVDTIIHGAGIQSSRKLAKKSFAEFHRVVSVKVRGLGNLYRACRRHNQGRPVNYHLLTSTFSFMGNDGQPDYGAANETLNRIALTMQDREPNAHWTSLAWLAWDGVGMTRGSEYEALGKQRNLRAVTETEGSELFAALMRGRATAPVNILMSDRELEWYGVDLASAARALPERSPHRRMGHADLRVSLAREDLPFLEGHLASGTPVWPGAMEIEYAARAALRLRPEMKVIGFEDIAFLRFLKVLKGQKTPIRAEAHLRRENEHEARVHVRIYSDFIHRDGTVLEKDRLHFEGMVLMHRQAVVPMAEIPLFAGGKMIPDPFQVEGANVFHGGLFAHLDSLVVANIGRAADFTFDGRDHTRWLQEAVTPFVLLDAAFTFSIIFEDEGGMPVGIADRIGSIRLVPDRNDLDLHAEGRAFRIVGANPMPDGDIIRNPLMTVMDTEGRPVAVMRDIRGRRFGMVSNEQLQRVQDQWQSRRADRRSA